MKDLKSELWELIGWYGEAMAKAGYYSHDDHGSMEDFYNAANLADDLEIKIRAFIANVEMKEK